MESLPFSYTSLSREENQIRLLHIPKRGQQSEDDTVQQEISCTFSIVSLSDPPPYEAISYVWGEPIKDKTISINGEPVAVTENLYDALSEVRLPDEERVVWADAVCINQNDGLERTHQVSNMRYIYERALRVLVYLGPAWTGCEEILEFFETSAGDPDIHYTDVKSPCVTIKGKTILGCPELQSYLDKFFDLTWWKRIWTVQEFILAKAVIFHVGPHTLTEKALHLCQLHISEHAYTCCSGLMKSLQQFSTNVWTIRALFRRWKLLEIHRAFRKTSSFIDILSSFRTRHSYDPRDMIFGLLGLTSENWEDLIIPDYSRSTQDVYCDFATACVQRVGTLDFMYHCYRGGRLGLPSFVPDWSVPIGEGLNSLYRGRTVRQNFSPSCGAKAQMTFVTPSQAIFKGLIFEKIAQIGPSATGEPSYAEKLHSMYEFAGIESAADKRTDAVIESEMIFAITMCCGMNDVVPEEKISGHPGALKQYWPIFKKWQAWAESLHHASMNNRDAQRFHSAAVLSSFERRFVKTETGRFGMAPDRTEEGDVIAILAGSKTPFVLRPQKDIGAAEPSDQAYSLVGDAYVYGIMSGQAWPEDDSKLPDIRMI